LGVPIETDNAPTALRQWMSGQVTAFSRRSIDLLF